MFPWAAGGGVLSAATDRRCEGGPPLAGQMRLGAQTAAGSSEGMVIEPTLTVHAQAANRAMTPSG